MRIEHCVEPVAPPESAPFPAPNTSSTEPPAAPSEAPPTPPAAPQPTSNVVFIPPDPAVLTGPGMFPGAAGAIIPTRPSFAAPLRPGIRHQR